MPITFARPRTSLKPLTQSIAIVEPFGTSQKVATSGPRARAQPRPKNRNPQNSTQPRLRAKVRPRQRPFPRQANWLAQIVPLPTTLKGGCLARMEHASDRRRSLAPQSNEIEGRKPRQARPRPPPSSPLPKLSCTRLQCKLVFSDKPPYAQLHDRQNEPPTLAPSASLPPNV